MIRTCYAFDKRQIVDTLQVICQHCSKSMAIYRALIGWLCPCRETLHIMQLTLPKRKKRWR